MSKTNIFFYDWMDGEKVALGRVLSRNIRFSIEWIWKKFLEGQIKRKVSTVTTPDCERALSVFLGCLTRKKNKCCNNYKNVAIKNFFWKLSLNRKVKCSR
jgi:hypothetical protein